MIVIIGFSYVVIINMTVIIFCHFSVIFKSKKKKKKERKSVNKAVYTPPQSRTGGQERYSIKYTHVLFGRGRNAKIARKSKMLRTNRPTNRPTNKASSRVACPRLNSQNSVQKD